MGRNIEYITLNILRVANVISLLLVAVTSWITLVVTIKAGSFFFFDGVSRLVTSLVSIFLITSELSLFNRYFAKHWPVLGPESGFVFLGLMMILLGSSVLENLREEIVRKRDYNKKEALGALGMALWPLVLSSGILSSLLGGLNIIATYVFCDEAQGITSRQVRMHNTTAPAKKPDSFKAFSTSSGSRQQSISPPLPRYTSTQERRQSRFRLPLGVAKSKKTPPSKQDDNRDVTEFSLSSLRLPDIEKAENPLDRASPIVPEIQRPPTALHPAFNNESQRYPASSRYSVVSDMTRF